MTDEMLENMMLSQYHNVFKEILLTAIKSNPKLTPDFLDQTIKRQREIESEIDKRAREMAQSLVERLKQKGWPSTEPTEKQLEKEIRRTFREFGVEE